MLSVAFDAIAAVDLCERRRHGRRRAEEVGIGEGASELHPLLVPVSPQNTLHLPIEEAEYCRDQETLVVHKNLHDIQVDLRDPVILRLVGEQDKLDAKQRDEDEGCSHGPHVEAGLGLVRHSQLGDENPNDVEQEEKIHHQCCTDGAVDNVQQ